jgi:hypothetical protein
MILLSLARCVMALVDNAVQHSPAGATVESTSPRGTTLLLQFPRTR